MTSIFAVDTATIKTIHVTSVALSYSLFFLRGIWMLNNSDRLQQRWARTVPDTVDSILFLSAVTLAWQLGFSPLHEPWLAAKIAALPLYIALGMVALRFGKTKRMRLAAWLLAQAVFVYMASVAMTHDPVPW